MFGKNAKVFFLCFCSLSGWGDGALLLAARKKRWESTEQRWQTMTRYLSCVKRFQKVFWMFSPTIFDLLLPRRIVLAATIFWWKTSRVWCVGGKSEGVSERDLPTTANRADFWALGNTHASSTHQSYHQLYLLGEKQARENNVRATTREKNFLIFRLCKILIESNHIWRNVRRFFLSQTMWTFAQSLLTSSRRRIIKIKLSVIWHCLSLHAYYLLCLALRRLLMIWEVPWWQHERVVEGEKEKLSKSLQEESHRISGERELGASTLNESTYRWEMYLQYQMVSFFSRFFFSSSLGFHFHRRENFHVYITIISYSLIIHVLGWRRRENSYMIWKCKIFLLLSSLSR